MVRAAEAIARGEVALALVTGENLGQVASQTLENLHTIDSATSLPVFRPLVGMDKLQIIEEARRIGTYETSIEPHGDCCSFLMPPNPATSSTPAQLERAERGFDVPAEVDRLVSESRAVAVGEGTPGAIESFAETAQERKE
jgi:thiamine biosynthesis protein ThiI